MGVMGVQSVQLVQSVLFLLHTYPHHKHASDFVFWLSVEGLEYLERSD